MAIESLQMCQATHYWAGVCSSLPRAYGCISSRIRVDFSNTAHPEIFGALCTVSWGGHMGATPF